MATVEERVARGAARLDRERPDWWRNIRDMRPLDTRAMNTCSDCVAGRVFGSFMDMDWVQAEADEAIGDVDYDDIAGDYGFTADWSAYGDNRSVHASDEEFVQLAAAWNREIDAREEADRAKV